MTRFREAPGFAALVQHMLRREFLVVVRGIGIYVATSVAMLAALWLLLIDIRALEVAGILIPDDPFRAPLSAALFVLASYLAVSATVSTARDRESRTLEVLFFAPVDECSYIVSKVAAHVLAYLAMLPMVALVLAIFSFFSGFALTWPTFAGLLLAVIPVAMMVGLGVLLSTWASRVRTAILLLIAVFVVLLGSAAAYAVVLMVPIDNPSSPVIPMRDALAGLNTGLRQVSPFALLLEIVQGGSLAGNLRAVALPAISSLLGTCVLVAGAVLLLRRRGPGESAA